MYNGMKDWAEDNPALILPPTSPQSLTTPSRDERGGEGQNLQFMKFVFTMERFSSCIFAHRFLAFLFPALLNLRCRVICHEIYRKNSNLHERVLHVGNVVKI